MWLLGLAGVHVRAQNGNQRDDADESKYGYTATAIFLDSALNCPSIIGVLANKVPLYISADCGHGR